MAQVFLGSLMCVPYNFAPVGWAFCAGQLLPISKYTALFSLLGTTYGGDGKVTFALPDLQGRSPISSGQGPGLSLYDLGQAEGEELHTLITPELPIHSHTPQAASGRGVTTSTTPAGNVLAGGGANEYAPPNSPVNQTLSANAVHPAGGNLPHENRMPFLAMNWVIALQGIFPARP